MIKLIFTLDNFLHFLLILPLFALHQVIAHYLGVDIAGVYAFFMFLFVRELTQIQAHLGNDFRKGWSKLSAHKIMEALAPSVLLLLTVLTYNWII